MKIFDLTDFINKENNKTALVCGMGPSIGPYIDRIKNKKDNEIIISCSDVDKMTGISPDYWVWANSNDTIVKLNDRFKQHPNTVIVHADSVDVTPRSWIEENVTNTYVGYDQRHFDNQSCTNCPNSCSNRIDGRMTIQEQLQNFTGYDIRYNAGCTVALHMTSLAILLGCKKIHVFGVDLDYSLGYVDKVTYNPDTFQYSLPGILNDFTTINESAKKINVEVFNMSETSHLKCL